MTTVAEVRSLFPAAERAAYFVTNGYGLLPTTAATAMQDAVGGLAARGYSAHHRLLQGVNDVRARVARLVGATEDEIGFVRNTADGVGWAAESLALRPGDEVIVFAGDYATIVYPFMALAEQGRGVKVRVVPTDGGRVTPELVAESLRPQTKAVALSWVRYDTGFRCDLVAIGKIVAGHGAYFIVDGVQGVGALPLDVHAARISVLAAGVHKWMCGLAGLGIVYVDRSIIGSLRSTRAGKEAMIDPDEYRYPFALRRQASRVEDGAINELAICGLGHSLDVMLDVGLPAVAEQIHTVTEHLCLRWRDQGGRVRSERTHEHWSGIVLLEPPSGIDAREMTAELVADRVILSERDGAIWIGAHFYTTIDDAERVVAHLR